MFERQRFERLFDALRIFRRATLAAIVDWVDQDSVNNQAAPKTRGTDGRRNRVSLPNMPAMRIEELGRRARDDRRDACGR